MKFDVLDLLKLLPMVGSVVAQGVAFKERFEELLGDQSPDDQETLKAAYQDLIAENDEGHARLQAKLAAAALNP